MSSTAPVWWGRALASLTLCQLRRYAREGRVVRSLLWPMFITPLTLAATLAVITWMRSPDVPVAVTASVAAELSDALSEEGLRVVVLVDPAEAVADGRAPIGTNGATIWTASDGDATRQVETVLRRSRGSGWIHITRRTIPAADEIRRLGGLMLRPLALLFVLYALAFTLGALARDRDGAILDAELTLPVVEGVLALARWVAAVAVLLPAHAAAVGMLQLMMPADAPWQHLWRGSAAIATAAGIGIAAAGGAARKQGFSGPFALGSALVAGPVAIGSALPALQTLPLFGITGSARGELAFLLGLLTGPVAAWVYSVRERRVR